MIDAGTQDSESNATPGTHHRARFDAVVRFNRQVCREHYILRLALPGGFPATRPGQFVQLGCRPPDGAIDLDRLLCREHKWESGRGVVIEQQELCGSSAFLRRPFSLAGRGDDASGTWIDVIHRVVGVGTGWLAGLKEDDKVDLIGPLGNWFSLPRGKSIGLLVGGGVGLPPMFYLAQTLAQARWAAVGFVGATTADLLAVTFVEGVVPDQDGAVAQSVVQFAQLGYGAVVTTDDGSLGLRGRITDGLVRYLQSQSPEDAQQTVVFTCGPEAMMHAVADLAGRCGVACQVCLEQAMACGMGTCQSCVVRIGHDQDDSHGVAEDGRAWRYRLACSDGPIFEAQQVVW